ncbi:MAG: hypothetical protein IPJ11_08695 [Gemmatimonadetes bacterium]|nr:hypothetical protein [Gemmatimonadota bacterium]
MTTAIQFMASRGQSPRLPSGDSLGGAAVVAASIDLPSVHAVATIGAHADPANASRLFGLKAIAWYL